MRVTDGGHQDGDMRLNQLDAEVLLYELHAIMQTLRGMARPSDPTIRDRIRAALKAFRTP